MSSSERPAAEAGGVEPEIPDAPAPQSNSRAYALMASGTTVSRVLGFARTALLAVAIGSNTPIGDIFEKANVIPTIIFMLVAGGIFNVVLVPQLIKASKNADRGSAYTSKLITLTVTFMAAATILLTLLAGPIISALTVGWSEPMLALATAFAYWCLPQVFFYGVYSVVGQVLNAHGRFGWFMWAPVVNNIVQIAVIGTYIGLFGAFRADTDQLAEWTTAQTVLLAGGSTLGIALQALVLFAPLRTTGLRIRPNFRFRGMGLTHVGKIAAWTLASMMVGNLASLLYSRIASEATAARESLSAGGASVAGEYALNTSQLITVLPHSIFALSLATVIFNELTRAFHDDRAHDVPALLSKGLRTTAVPIVFASVAIVVLAGPLGRLFGGTSVDAAAAGAAIGQLLLLTALGLPFKSAHFFLIRVFYAQEDTKTPMLIQTAIAVVGLIAAFTMAALIPPTNIVMGIALLYGATNVLSAILAHFLVVRRHGDYGVGRVVDTYIRVGWFALIAGAAGSVALWLLGGFSFGFAFSGIFPAVATLAICGVVMIVVYLLLLKAARLEELDEFIGPLARRIPDLSRRRASAKATPRRRGEDGPR
ncbi:murein biosynthesis integral membrane protein MurJ [Zhihengliuella halotolerans]|uniref:Putative peptidoglycan lipid II flippase n=1 Tax=Zhihengliuella halotolerans TaxID=370736 RepID=A0A4Q8AFU6_9MICC|nr:lipid II flippase MurJ [Zhihengliuella halotolerans]RZU63148.1 putative peptidoglycan lipid II flippase [Zhihengliuella halotolerans]